MVPETTFAAAAVVLAAAMQIMLPRSTGRPSEADRIFASSKNLNLTRLDSSGILQPTCLLATGELANWTDRNVRAQHSELAKSTALGLSRARGRPGSSPRQRAVHCTASV